MDPIRWNKVLVVQTSFLGDTVLTVPLLSEIKSRFPQTKLSVLCNPQARELLRDHPDIDEIIVDDKRRADKGWLGLWRKADMLKARGFTIALSPHKSFRTALLLFLAGIPYRVGFYQSKGWFLFNARVTRDAYRHDVERNLSVLKAFGIEPEECNRTLQLETLAAVDETVARTFQSLGVDGSRLRFGLNPGSVWPTKRWTINGYAELVGLLKEHYACDVLLFGGPEDAEIVAEIHRLSGDRCVSLVGKISLRELPAALSRCDLLITNDSGPMHVAVARGVPVVAVFCATTPSLGFYPYSSRAVVVEKELPCRPCASHGGRRCPLGTEDCMRLIRAEEVFRAAERLLNGRALVDDSSGSSYEPGFITL